MPVASGDPLRDEPPEGQVFLDGLPGGEGTDGVPPGWREVDGYADDADEDRLARFGADWLKRLLAAYGATLEILRPRKSGGRQELLGDFICLMTMFAGRLYGMRSTNARRRLLAESGQCPQPEDAG